MRWSSKRCFSVEYTLLDSLLLMLDSLLLWFSLSLFQMQSSISFSFLSTGFRSLILGPLVHLKSKKEVLEKEAVRRMDIEEQGAKFLPKPLSLFLSLEDWSTEREVENGHLGDLIILFPLSRYKSSSSSCIVAVDAQAILFNASLAFCFQYFSFPHKESVAMDDEGLFTSLNRLESSISSHTMVCESTKRY